MKSNGKNGLAKRVLTIILALCMVVSLTLPAFAAETTGRNYDGAVFGFSGEQTTENENDGKDYNSINQSETADNGAKDTEEKNAEPETGAGIEDAVSADQEEWFAGELTAVAGDAVITVNVPAEAKLPKDVTLTVKEIKETTWTGKENAEYQGYLDQTIEAVSAESQTIAKDRAAKFYDISFTTGKTGLFGMGKTNARTVEPEAPVDVQISYKESIVPEDGQTLKAVHFPEDAQAEVLNVNEEGEDKISFTADSFSVYGIVYTVDFWYGEYEYHLNGEGEIMVSELLKELGITDFAIADVVDVRFTDESLVKVEKVEEEHGVADWKLTSLKAFDSEEKLEIELKDGTVVEVRVTDAAGDVFFVDRKGGNNAGTAYFKTLREAVLYANEGNSATNNANNTTTIKMLNNYTLTSADSDTMIAVARHPIVFDGDGNTLKFSNSQNGGIKLKAGREKGIDGDQNSQTYNSSNIVLTFKSVTFERNDYNGIAIDGSNAVVSVCFSNCIIDGNKNTNANGSLIAMNGGTLTLNDTNVINHTPSATDVYAVDSAAGFVNVSGATSITGNKSFSDSSVKLNLKVFGVSNFTINGDHNGTIGITNYRDEQNTVNNQFGKLGNRSYKVGTLVNDVNPSTEWGLITASVENNTQLWWRDPTSTNTNSEAVFHVVSSGNTYTDLSAAYSSAAATDTIEMLHDYILSANVQINGTKNITLKTSQEYKTANGKNATIVRKPSFTNASMITKSGNGSLTLESVTIDGNQVSVSTMGGIFTVSGGTLTLNDGAVLQNSKATEGGGINLTSGQIYMNSGSTIRYCEATSSGANGRGGSVYMHTANAYLTLNDGCLIEHCIANRTDHYAGGGVCIVDTNHFEMNGGTIQYCSAPNSAGGAIAVDHGDHAYIKGGLITNCTAGQRGGAIETHGATHISGGTITNCDGGKVGGAINMYTTTNDNEGVVYLSGSPKIFGNYNEYDSNNVFLCNIDVYHHNHGTTGTSEVASTDKVRLEGKLNSDAMIGIWAGQADAEGQFGIRKSASVSTANLDCFTNDRNPDLYGTVGSGTTLVWSQGIKVKVKLFMDDSLSTAKTIELKSGEGHYTFDYSWGNDVTISIAEFKQNYEANKDYKPVIDDSSLDFRFATLENSSEQIKRVRSKREQVSAQWKFSNYYSTADTGTPNSKIETTDTLVLYYNVKPNFKLTDASGNLLYLENGNPAIFMELKNACDYVWKCYTRATSGEDEVFSKYTSKDYQVMVLVPGYEYKESATAVLTGDYNVTLTTAKTTDADFPFRGTSGSSAVITRSADAANKKSMIQSSATSLSLTNIILDGNNVTAESDSSIIALNAGTLNVNSGTVIQNAKGKKGAAIHTGSTDTGSAATVVNVNNAQFLNNEATEDAGGAIYASTNTTIRIAGSTFNGNKAATAGGAIAMYGTMAGTQKATFTDNGSYFCNNEAQSGAGGAIRISEWTDVTLSATRFLNNESKGANAEGGAIAVLSKQDKQSTLTITGGEYKNNESAKDGGAIKIGGYGTLNISNAARLESNSASGNGGGIVVAPNAVVKMDGSASIISCSAANGGGIHAGAGSTVTMDGAVDDNMRIYNCSATASGGGIYLASSATAKSTLTLKKAAAINQCTAADGGGVYLDQSATLSMDGTGATGTKSGSEEIQHTYIAHCTATNNGAGVYANSGATISLNNDAEVSNNTNAKLGGGVYLDGATLTLGNANMSGNTATTAGAGVYTASGSTVNVSGSPTVYDNKVNDKQNNIYVSTNDTIHVVDTLTEAAKIGVYGANSNIKDAGKQFGVYASGKSANLNGFYNDAQNGTDGKPLRGAAKGTDKVIWDGYVPLKITNRIVSSMGETYKPFTFKISVADAESCETYEYTKGDSTETLSLADGSGTFTLAGDEYVTIRVPKGKVITITESDSQNYSTSAATSNEDAYSAAPSASGEATSDTKTITCTITGTASAADLTITNTRNNIAPELALEANLYMETADGEMVHPLTHHSVKLAVYKGDSLEADGTQLHNLLVNADSSGWGYIYDLDVEAGFYHITVDQTTIPQHVVDNSGKVWKLKQVRVDSEYAWRTNGDENRRRTGTVDSYASPAEVLGAYDGEDGNTGLFNRYLDFYIHAIYEEDSDAPVFSDKLSFTLQKNWNDNGDTTAPTGGSVDFLVHQVKSATSTGINQNGTVTVRLVGSDEAVIDTTKANVGDTVKLYYQGKGQHTNTQVGVKYSRSDNPSQVEYDQNKLGGIDVQPSDTAEHYKEVTVQNSGNQIYIIDNVMVIKLMDITEQEAVQKFENIGFGASTFTTTETDPLGSGYPIKVTLTPDDLSGNSWQKTISDLPAHYQDGDTSITYTYYVEENRKTGRALHYNTASFSGDAGKDAAHAVGNGATVTVTNSYSAAAGDTQHVTIQKLWQDQKGDTLKNHPDQVLVKTFRIKLPDGVSGTGTGGAVVTTTESVESTFGEPDNWQDNNNTIVVNKVFSYNGEYYYLSDRASTNWSRSDLQNMVRAIQNGTTNTLSGDTVVKMIMNPIHDKEEFKNPNGQGDYVNMSLPCGSICTYNGKYYVLIGSTGSSQNTQGPGSHGDWREVASGYFTSGIDLELDENSKTTSEDEIRGTEDANGHIHEVIDHIQKKVDANGLSWSDADKEIQRVYKDGVPEVLEITKAGGWETEYTMEAGYLYFFFEIVTPGFDTKYVNMEQGIYKTQSNPVQIINSQEVGSLNVTKQWPDSDSKAVYFRVKRAFTSGSNTTTEDITESLYANPTGYGLTSGSFFTRNEEHALVINNSSGSWGTVTITDLPLANYGYVNDPAYSYYVEEVGYKDKNNEVQWGTPDSLQGYTSASGGGTASTHTTAAESGVVLNGTTASSITIVNGETGHNLTVSKTASASTSESFTVYVESTALTEASYVGNDGTSDATYQVSDGRITLNLSAGDSVTLKDLPEGSYTVTEAIAPGWSPSYSYRKGTGGTDTTGNTVTLDDDTSVTITNTKSDAPAASDTTPLVPVVIKKVWSNYTPVDSDKITFTVQGKDSSGNVIDLPAYTIADRTASGFASSQITELKKSDTYQGEAWSKLVYVPAYSAVNSSKTYENYTGAAGQTKATFFDVSTNAYTGGYTIKEDSTSVNGTVSPGGSWKAEVSDTEKTTASPTTYYTFSNALDLSSGVSTNQLRVDVLSNNSHPELKEVTSVQLVVTYKEGGKSKSAQMSFNVDKQDMTGSQGHFYFTQVKWPTSWSNVAASKINFNGDTSHSYKITAASSGSDKSYDFEQVHFITNDTHSNNTGTSRMAQNEVITAEVKATKNVETMTTPILQVKNTYEEIELPAPTGVNLRFLPWILIALAGGAIMLTLRRRRSA